LMQLSLMLFDSITETLRKENTININLCGPLALSPPASALRGSEH